MLTAVLHFHRTNLTSVEVLADVKTAELDLAAFSLWLAATITAELEGTG